MEIILRSINQDTTIVTQKIGRLQSNLPTAVGYADDIMCIVKNPTDIQKIFSHYEKFTKVSGLELNADKTEILSSKAGIKFAIRYDGIVHHITSIDKIKINGIIFNMNETLQFDDNWNSGLKKWKSN